MFAQGFLPVGYFAQGYFAGGELVAYGVPFSRAYSLDAPSMRYGVGWNAVEAGDAGHVIRQRFGVGA